MEKNAIILLALAAVALSAIFLLSSAGLLAIFAQEPGLGSCSEGIFTFKQKQLSYNVCPDQTITSSNGGTTVTSNYELTADSFKGSALIARGPTRSVVDANTYHEFIISKDSSNIDSLSFSGVSQLSVNSVSDGNCKGYFSVIIGGTTVFVDGAYITRSYKSFSHSFTDIKIVRTSVGWLYSDAEGHSSSVQAPDGEIKLLFTVTGSGTDCGGTSFSYDFKELLVEGDFPDEPSKPSPGALASAMVKLRDWIGGIIKRLLGLSIVGAQTVTPGTTETYSVVLQAPYPVDADYKDGKMQVRYCNVGLVDSSGAVILEKGPVECSDIFTTSYSVKIPESFNNNAVVALMTQANATYNFVSKAWTWTSEEVIVKEAYDLNTKQVIPDKPSPKLFSWFGGFIDWIKRLFGGAA